MSDIQQHSIKIALKIYGLELDPDRVDAMLVTWLKQYDPNWILKAIVESLYRGRYKIVSVENILKDWQRLGNPRYQFTPEYEREILEKIPQLSTPEVSPTSSLAEATVAAEVPVLSSMPSESYEPVVSPLACQLSMSPALLSSQDLNPEESAPFQSHYHSFSIPERSSEDSESNLEPAEREDSSSEQSEPVRSIPTLDPLSRRSRFQNRYDRSKPERIASQPASRKLFNTLKAIVDPNHQERLEVLASSTFPPLAIGNDLTNKIANFTLPIDANEEQHV